MRWKFVAQFVFIVFFSPSAVASRTLVTEAMCGAGAGEINAALVCMQAGYKHVYMGNWLDLKQIRPDLKEFAESKQVFRIHLAKSRTPVFLTYDLFLFTDQGRQRANVLARVTSIVDHFHYGTNAAFIKTFLQMFAQHRKTGCLCRLARTCAVAAAYVAPKMPEELVYQWALNGFLLGYNEGEVRDFYSRGNRAYDFEGDWVKAKAYFEKYKDVAFADATESKKLR
jgi:hypothetical protein